MKEYMIPITIIIGIMGAILFTKTLDTILQRNTMELLLPITIILYFCKDLKK